MSKDSNTKLITLTFLFLILINFPILAIFDREGLLLGVPTLYFYLFMVWAAVIGITAWINTRYKSR